jgi:hypothetical protein
LIRCRKGPGASSSCQENFTKVTGERPAAHVFSACYSANHHFRSHGYVVVILFWMRRSNSRPIARRTLPKRPVVPRQGARVLPSIMAGFCARAIRLVVVPYFNVNVEGPSGRMRPSNRGFFRDSGACSSLNTGPGPSLSRPRLWRSGRGLYFMAPAKRAGFSSIRSFPGG